MIAGRNSNRSHSRFSRTSQPTTAAPQLPPQKPLSFRFHFTSAVPAFCDRRPFLCRRANFLCRRANFFCRRRPHAARPRHPPFRSCRRLNPPKLPPIARHSAVHRFAILCQPMRTSDRRVRPYWRSRLFVPAIPFTFTTHLVSLFREAFPGRLCSIAPRTV